MTDTPTFRETVALVAAKAREKLPPEVNGRIASAVKLVLGHDIVMQPNGTIRVGSSSDPLKTYTLEGATCDCQDFVHGAAPGGWCQHRVAAGIEKRVRELLATENAPVPPPADALETAAPPAAWSPPAGAIHPVTQQAHERSPQIGALMQALARAQATMTNPGFDETNPHFRNRYASMAAVRDAVVPALSAAGIAVTQLPTTPAPGWVAVTTGLWHQSGEYLCSTLQLPVPKDDPQGYGSAITYARRYALQALVCVAGDADDDGEYVRQARGK